MSIPLLGQEARQSLLIFGGGSGIGFAAARLAAERGSRVVMADIDPSPGKLLTDRGLDVKLVEVDVLDERSVERTVDIARAHPGGFDRVLLTVGGATIAEFADLDPSTWERELAFNLTSAYYVTRHVLPVLVEQKRGAVVLTSSGQAVMAATDRAAYAAAKAGVVSLTKSLAGSVAPHGVRVNCIAPGPTDTPRFRAMNGGEEGVEGVRAKMPMGWIPTPEDCAEPALHLLSEAARAITGQTIHVNGGLLMPS